MYIKVNISWKTLSQFLNEHAMKIINFKKKKKVINESKNQIKLKNLVKFVKKTLKTNIWTIKNMVTLVITAIIKKSIEDLIE